MGVHCCCLHVNYIVYKHFDRSLHVGSSDPTCVQNFRLVPLTVFEIQGFKLKNKNDKKNWRNGLFAIYISHVSGPILTKCYVHIHIDLNYHHVVSKVDYQPKVKVQIGIFKCTGIMGQDLVHIQSTTVLCDTHLRKIGKRPGACGYKGGGGGRARNLPI